MKATAEAPSNIAFIKYWGRKNEELRLPTNGSISMNLSNCKTVTTVMFDDTLEKDLVTINEEEETGEGYRKISKHLDRIRKLADIDKRAKVVSKNTFPRSTGLSSSASGFAALTLATIKAVGLELSEKELSILTRQGSGSACRSIPDGFVEWLDADASDASYAVSIFPPEHWDLVDVVCILSTEKKAVPTSVGQLSSESSPFFAERLKGMPEKIEKMKKIIADKNFQLLGELLEEEALDLHRIMETSVPPLHYMTSETRDMIELVKKWRGDGLSVYFTVNTGENIHLICEESSLKDISSELKRVSVIKKTIVNRPSVGARITKSHLF